MQRYRPDVLRREPNAESAAIRQTVLEGCFEADPVRMERARSIPNSPSAH
jgi:hypothetical protein